MKEKLFNQKTRVVVAGVCLVIAVFLPLSGIGRALVFLLPYLTVGFPVLRAAFLSLIRGHWMTETFLMSVASLGAFALGEYAEGVAVMLFYAVGELFEEYAVGKSRNSIAQLTELCADEATVLRDGVWQTVPTGDVRVGETVRVLPGERIPLDGTVTEGESSLDTRSLTGEGIPRDVSAGDEVLSGCVNLNGVLTLRAEKEFYESTASKILSLVEDATANRARAESFVSSFARWYTPTVIGCALLLGLLPPLVDGLWSVWIYRALEFLVVSCPCALIISVPLTYFGAIGGAARRGILIKGSDRMELLASARCVALDKTGTLTEGAFRVTDVEGDRDCLRIAALCEQFSNHPIAVSLQEGYGDSVRADAVCDVREYAGFGVSAEVDGTRYYVGNEALLRRFGISSPFAPSEDSFVYVASRDRALGRIRIADRVRPEAKAALQTLRSLGVQRTWVVTGDGRNAARRVAEQVGADGFDAELLPEGKIAVLDRLRASAGTVVFVGDGINDAPVLVRSDVGIAMGAIGSDAAIEAADAVLMHDDLSALPKAVRLARKTRRIVRQNVIFSISVKLGTMVLCTLGVATMWHAVFADVGVSVLAVLNAMRTLSKKD